MFFRSKPSMPSSETALPGRPDKMPVPAAHFVNGNPIAGEVPAGMEEAIFGLGCFWGAERIFWKADGVWSTAVGYAAGLTPNPTYKEVCSGMTGHNEVVRVIFDPKVVSYAQLLKLFFDSHDPTQGMRQGNDSGTQYRSGVYTTSDAQAAEAAQVRAAYQIALTTAGLGAITTEVIPATEFYYAEDYHQQYLAKNPHGYCSMQPTGVSCPIGLDV